MKRTAQMQWVPTVLLLSVISIGCQPMTTDYQLAADQNISSDEIAIAIQKPLRKESQALLNALTKGAPISFRTLEIASTLLNSYVSRPQKTVLNLNIITIGAMTLFVGSILVIVSLFSNSKDNRHLGTMIAGGFIAGYPVRFSLILEMANIRVHWIK